MLDELTLEHMTQDCSSLKNQLLRLKTLLQVRIKDANEPKSERLHASKLADTHTVCSTIGQQHIHMLGRYMHKRVQFFQWEKTLWPLDICHCSNALPFEYVTHKNHADHVTTSRLLFRSYNEATYCELSGFCVWFHVRFCLLNIVLY